MSNRMVIDTSVLIDFRRDYPDATRYLAGLLDTDSVVVHPAAAAELLEGVRDRTDQRETMEFLAKLRRLNVKSSDFEGCLR